MGDPQNSTAVDFQAKTMGISTSCQVMTSDCKISYILEPGLNFTCPSGFAGNFYEPIPGYYDPTTNTYVGGGASTGIGFATDARLPNYSRIVNLSDGHATETVPAGSEGSVMGLLAQNPVFLSTWAAGYLNLMDTHSPLANVSGSGYSDPQIFPNAIGESHWLLKCNATIHDINYTFVNGFLHALQAQEAPPDWDAFFTAPLAWAQQLPQVKTAMGDAVVKAAYLAQNSTHLADIVRSFCTHDSRYPSPYIYMNIHAYHMTH